MRKRHRGPVPGHLPFLGIGMFLAVLLALPVPVPAQGVHVQGLEVSPFRQDLVTVGKGFARPQWEWNVGLLFDFQHDPLELRGTPAGSGVRKVVSGQLAAHVLASVALLDFLDFGVVLPVVAWQDGDGLAGEASPRSFGVGDLRLAVRLMMYQTKNRLFSIALTPEFAFPTGRLVDRYMGASTVTITPWVTTGLEWARGGLAVNLGYRPRKRETTGDLTLDDQLMWRAGGWAGLVDRKLELVAEVGGAVGLTSPLKDTDQHPVEALGALRYRPTCAVDLTAGAGGELAKAYPSPDWRVFLGFNVGGCPRKKVVAADRDGDGVPDDADNCPEVANALQEDNDQDRKGDACDDDDDSDGVPDSRDNCPLAANPGQEDLDRDARGDPCDDDDDGDGIPDGTDNCPTVSNPDQADADRNGRGDACDASTDRDGDGIPDREDACPTEPETKNGYKDEDGCPDEPEKVEGQKITIPDRIHFDFNQASLQERSLPAVDSVARMLKEHPEITKVRVEAHTDLKGTPAYNLTLSRSRAAAVMKALAERGIAPRRITSQGYGLSRPLVTPEVTEEDAQSNRRVEFSILEEGGAPGKAPPAGPGGLR